MRQEMAAAVGITAIPLALLRQRLDRLLATGILRQVEDTADRPPAIQTSTAAAAEDTTVAAGAVAYMDRRRLAMGRPRPPATADRRRHMGVAHRQAMMPMARVALRRAMMHMAEGGRHLVMVARRPDTMPMAEVALRLVTMHMAVVGHRLAMTALGREVHHPPTTAMAEARHLDRRTATQEAAATLSRRLETEETIIHRPDDLVLGLARRRDLWRRQGLQSASSVTRVPCATTGLRG